MFGGMIIFFPWFFVFYFMVCLMNVQDVDKDEEGWRWNIKKN